MLKQFFFVVWKTIRATLHCIFYIIKKKKKKKKKKYIYINTALQN
jgi:hypothetical protein